MINDDATRPLRGEGRLTNEVLREKMRRMPGPIWGPNQVPNPIERPRSRWPR